MTADLTPTTDAIRATILRGFEGHDHNLSDEEIQHYAWNTARNLPSVAAETMTWLLDQLAAAHAFIAELTTDDSPCQRDHHGQCQVHGWLNSGECINVAARRLRGVA